jgi:hypothetical protein
MELHHDAENVFTIQSDTIIYTRIVRSKYCTIRLHLKEGEKFTDVLNKMQNVTKLDDDTMLSFAKLQKEAELCEAM